MSEIVFASPMGLVTQDEVPGRMAMFGRLFKKIARMFRRSPVLRLELGAEALDDLAWFAQRRGLPLRAWANSVLVSQLPPNIRSLRGLERTTARTLDAAFAEADKADHEAGTDVPATVETPHPCVSYRRTTPEGFRPSDCAGSCQAQNGRPCFWSAQRATECRLFALRTR